MNVPDQFLCDGGESIEGNIYGICEVPKSLNVEGVREGVVDSRCDSNDGSINVKLLRGRYNLTTLLKERAEEIRAEARELDQAYSQIRLHIRETLDAASKSINKALGNITQNRPEGDISLSTLKLQPLLDIEREIDGSFLFARALHFISSHLGKQFYVSSEALLLNAERYITELIPGCITSKEKDGGIDKYEIDMEKLLAIAANIKTLYKDR